MITDRVNSVRCIICGAGTERHVVHRGDQIASICEFQPEMTCPECNAVGTSFVHDDVSEGEVFKVCANCLRVAHIG